MLSPENRVVMINGANRGIGLAIARQLSDSGFKLSLGCRDPASVDKTQFAGPASLHHYDAGDVTTSNKCCLLYTSPSPRDATLARMPSSA